MWHPTYIQTQIKHLKLTGDLLMGNYDLFVNIYAWWILVYITFFKLLVSHFTNKLCDQSTKGGNASFVNVCVSNLSLVNNSFNNMIWASHRLVWYHAQMCNYWLLTVFCCTLQTPYLVMYLLLDNMVCFWPIFSN